MLETVLGRLLSVDTLVVELLRVVAHVASPRTCWLLLSDLDGFWLLIGFSDDAHDTPTRTQFFCYPTLRQLLLLLLLLRLRLLLWIRVEVLCKFLDCSQNNFLSLL